MLALVLQTRAIPGGWRLSLARPGARGVEADLDGVRVERVKDAIDALDRARVVVASDARMARAEREKGVILASLLDDVGLQGVLHGALGEARGRRSQLVLVVDVDGPFRGFPWELLVAPGGGEEEGGWRVVRRTAGHGGASATGLAVGLYLLDPEEPLAHERLEALQETLGRLGIPHGEVGEMEAPSVVHVIGHGDRDVEQTLFPTRTGVLGVQTPVHVLLPALAHHPLVVLDVCDAGSAVPAADAGAPARLLQAGAQAVIAPHQRWSIEAADAFADGLYTELSRGERLAEAVASGRRSVRALGQPFPDGRWWNPHLTVARVENAVRRLEEPGFVPEGWRVQGEARAWTRRAWKLAEAHGFLGLEHFLATWPDGGSTVLAHVRFHLTQQVPLGAIGHLQTRSNVALGDVRLTPRLSGLKLEAADAEQLADQLWNALDGALQALLGILLLRGEGVQTVTTLEPEADEAGVPAMGWEVLGGPEDGRPIQGETLGRAEQLGGDGIYGTCALVDPYLSRKALVWTPSGWRTRKPLRCMRAGQEIRLGPAPFHVLRGDVLHLTRATRVRAV